MHVLSELVLARAELGDVGSERLLAGAEVGDVGAKRLLAGAQLVLAGAEVGDVGLQGENRYGQVLDHLFVALNCLGEALELLGLDAMSLRDQLEARVYPLQVDLHHAPGLLCLLDEEAAGLSVLLGEETAGLDGLLGRRLAQVVAGNVVGSGHGNPQGQDTRTSNRTM